jgi:multidrug efflux pump subunit AcrA (membrane-fusion protein)
MSKRNKKQLFAALGTSAAIIVLTIIISLSLTQTPIAEQVPDEEETAREVTVMLAEPQNIVTDIQITGRVTPVERIDVATEVQGVFRSGARPFRTGNRFQQGEVLVQLDDTDVALELNASRSRFASALSALLPAIRQDFPQAYEAWADYVEDFNPEMPVSDLPEIEQRQLQFFISANNIMSQFYGIRAQENRLSKYTLRAPFTGELRNADQFPGGLVQPGAMLGEFVGDVYELESYISLSEKDFVAVGDVVELRSSVQDMPLEGRITRIGRSVDPGTQAFPVYVEVSSPVLRSGIYLEGSIAGRILENVVRIPRNLLTRENTVMIAEDGVATHKQVEPVFYFNGDVAVEGLESGDQLIRLRTGAGALAGTKVNPVVE